MLALALRPIRRRFIRKEFDAAMGNSIRDNVLDAYRFLIHRYQPDDKVFLFGFSRGAYTVRAVAALISRCGLLRPDRKGHLSIDRSRLESNSR